MNKLIDITHTVKASEAPSEGARYVFDPNTRERFWVEQVPEMPVPPGYFDGLPNPPLGVEQGVVPMSKEEFNAVVEMPDPEIPPAPVPTRGRKRKDSEGDR